MTGIDPGGDPSRGGEHASGDRPPPDPRHGGGDVSGHHHDAPRASARSEGLARVGSKPILWKWWLVAAVISVALWVGIVALVA